MPCDCPDTRVGWRDWVPIWDAASPPLALADTYPAELLVTRPARGVVAPTAGEIGAWRGRSTRRPDGDTGSAWNTPELLMVIRDVGSLNGVPLVEKK